MNTLRSKLQYPGYETGEYSDIALRTLPETVALIATFPWTEMDASSGLSLTGPSVVIEGTQRNFLKVGLYYGNQFCLYLLKGNGAYYVRITETLEDVLTLVADFFESKPIEEFFSREYDVRIRRHFVTRDFTYKVTWRRIVAMMAGPLSIIVPFGLITLLIGENVALFMFFGLLLSFAVYGISWMLFINHLIYSIGTSIKITTGQPVFEFRKWHEVRVYNKDDIKHISVYCWNGKRVHLRRTPMWSHFEIYEVEFKDGSTIRFSSLVLSTFITSNKFNRQIPRVHRTFPFTWNI